MPSLTLAIPPSAEDLDQVVGVVAADVGEYNSLAVGPDGLPVISYYDRTHENLKLVKCGRSDCSSGNIVSTIDPEHERGYYTDVVVGSDNRPVVAHFDEENEDLLVLKCGEPTCRSGNVTSVVDAAGAVGSYLSMTLLPGNLPIISYYDDTVGISEGLKVAKCGDPACSSGNIITLVEAGVDVGYDTTIALGSDDLPVVSYFEGGTAESPVPPAVKIVKCGDLACATSNVITKLADGVYYGATNSMVVPADGRPLVVYRSTARGSTVRAIKCGSASCATGHTITEIVPFISDKPAVALADDGLPIVSFYKQVRGRSDRTQLRKPDGDLMFLKCLDLACAQTTQPITIDGCQMCDENGNIGYYSAIAWGSDGQPIISYYNTTAGNLKVARCGDGLCSAKNIVTTVDDVPYLPTLSEVLLAGDA